METLKFKTNINCGGCVARVTPVLNANKGIENWEVNTNNPDKILTVQTSFLKPENIIQEVNKAGFKIEQIK
ncbi:MAG: heavy-metal-associated domain-containing protein [Chitinophagaceae bacterium]